MSWKATAYVKGLTQNITASEKLLLFVLSDYYNDHQEVAWPSVDRLAKEALLSERQARRLLADLEAKKILKRQARRGKQTSLYRFCALDPEESQSKAENPRLDKVSTQGNGRVDIPAPRVDISDGSSGHSYVPQTVEQEQLLKPFCLTPKESVSENKKIDRQEPKADPRHQLFMDLIFKAHQHYVKVHPHMNGATGKNLSVLLKGDSTLDEKRFRRMLKNYHASEDHAKADSPAFYVLKLPKYELGPLNKFGREKESEQVMGTGIGYATA